MSTACAPSTNLPEGSSEARHVVEAMNQLGPLSSPINENGSTNLADSGGISLSAWIAAFGAIVFPAIRGPSSGIPRTVDRVVLTRLILNRRPDQTTVSAR